MQSEWITRLDSALGIVIQTLAITGAVVSFVRWWFGGQLKNIKASTEEKIRVVEKDLVTHEHQSELRHARIDSMEKKLQTAEFNIASNDRALSRVEGMFVQYLEEQREERKDRHIDEKNIVDKLARIETHLNVTKALEKGFEQLASALRSQQR